MGILIGDVGANLMKFLLRSGTGFAQHLVNANP
jgi:hypothetical protein